jgi:hypothetical protein
LSHSINDPLTTYPLPWYAYQSRTHKLYKKGQKKKKRKKKRKEEEEEEEAVHVHYDHTHYTLLLLFCSYSNSLYAHSCIFLLTFAFLIFGSLIKLKHEKSVCANCDHYYGCKSDRL